jgi:hypothetical protein
MSDDAEVSYTVKELLKQLSDRIDTFMSLIGSKADQASVAQLHDKVEQVEARVTTVEHTLKANDNHTRANQEFRRWAWPVAISVLTALILILQAFHL